MEMEILLSVLSIVAIIALIVFAVMAIGAMRSLKKFLDIASDTTKSIKSDFIRIREKAEPLLVSTNSAMAETKLTLEQAKDAIAETKLTVEQAKGAVADSRGVIVEAQAVIREAKQPLITANDIVKRTDDSWGAILKNLEGNTNNIGDRVETTVNRTMDNVDATVNNLSEQVNQINQLAENVKNKVEDVVDSGSVYVNAVNKAFSAFKNKFSSSGKAQAGSDNQSKTGYDPDAYNPVPEERNRHYQKSNTYGVYNPSYKAE